MTRLPFLPLALFWAAFATCAWADDSSGTIAGGDAEGAAGLISDVERIVAAEAGDWFVDKEEMRQMYPALLQSVCRATPEARRSALEQLERRAAEAGDPRILHLRAGGRRTKKVERALKHDRHARALAMAVEGAGRDCPFWVKTEPGFLGRQSDRKRFTLSLETGGVVQIRQTDGTLTLGGGGNGRLLPGFGFGERFTLLGGVEFGGGAMLRPGPSPSQFIINYFPAIPIIARFRRVQWHYDVEAAPVALFQADDTSVSYGVRIGGGVGLSALRTRDFLPWAGVAIAYELYFPSGGRPLAHFLRGGLRVGIRWDP